MNNQHEINIHNVGTMAGQNETSKLLLRLYGPAGILGVFLGVWVYSRQRFRKVAPPVILLPWFLALTLVMAPAHFWVPDPYFGWWPLTEVKEMMIGITGFLFLWLNARMLSSM